MNADKITKLILEKIRQLSTKQKFSWEEFNDFNFVVDQREYLDKTLKILGEGSARKVYLLNSKKVLKCAKNDKGLAQNASEIELSNSKYRHLFANVIDFDSKDKLWIVSELVRAVESEEEMARLINYKGDPIDALYEMFANKKNHTKLCDYNKFLCDIYKLALDKKMYTPDITEIMHYGVTPDQRVVLLDYGLTNEISKEHYNSSNSYDD